MNIKEQIEKYKVRKEDAVNPISMYREDHYVLNDEQLHELLKAVAEEAWYERSLIKDPQSTDTFEDYWKQLNLKP